MKKIIVEGIKLVRVLVHKDDFDKLHSLMIYMGLNPEEIGQFKEVRKEYGRLRWTTGPGLLADNCIEVFVERYDFIMISRYGSYDSKVWDEEPKKPK